MNLKDFLVDLTKENIIDQNTHDRIYEHFLLRKSQTPTETAAVQAPKNQNSLLIAVGVIGVLLFGIGIIYLFAHNWDNLSRSTKTSLAFVPLILSLIANLFTVTKRKDNVVWQESTAISTFLAVGSMLALLLQIYQLPGIENYFFWYWAVLCLPVVYILRSHIAVFFVLLLILINTFGNPLDQSSFFRIPWVGSLGLFLGLIPYYIPLFKTKNPSIYFLLQQIALPGVITACVMISVQSSFSSIWLISYLLMANFNLFGNSHLMRNEDRMPNILTILSYVGMSSGLAYLIFNSRWNFQNITNEYNEDFRLYFIPILFFLALFQLFDFFRKEKLSLLNMHRLFFLIPLVFVGLNYFELDVYKAFLITAALFCFFLIPSAQKTKNEFLLFPAVSILVLTLISQIFWVKNFNLQFAYASVIPSIYLFASLFQNKDGENERSTLGVLPILVICFQILFLVIASFQSFWLKTDVIMKDNRDHWLLILLLIGIFIGIIVLLMNNVKILQNKNNAILSAISFAVPVFLFLAAARVLPMYHFFTLLLLSSGVLMVINGGKRGSLGFANLGLGLVALVLICRFFDIQTSLTVKGITFIVIGLSFFFANYLIIKNTKNETK